MIYIAVPSTKKAESNAWVKANADLQGGENTFSENVKKGSTPYCLISLADDGSDYVEKMKSHFSYTETLEALGLEELNNEQ